MPLKVPLTGGVNLLNDPREIADDEVTWAKNLFPVKPGVLKKRKAVGYVIAPSLSSDIGNQVGFFVPPFGGDILGVTAGRQSSGKAVIRAFKDDGTLTSFVGGVGDPVIYEMRPQMIPYLKRIYVMVGRMTGVTAFPGYNVSESGGTVTIAANAFNGVNNDISPRVAAIYRERMVYADLGSGYEDYIVFADPWDPMTIGDDVLAANGRAFRVGAREGDRIVALVEITQTVVGSPAQSALLVLKEHSAWLITGEPNLTTDTTDMFGSLVINKINIEAGCASAETVVNTPYGLLWASHDDVWLFDIGALPRKVGTKIQPALKHTADGSHYLWHAAYFDGAYRLSVFGEEQAESTNVPLQDQWWLDLRDGAPQSYRDAKWWGPMQYRPMNIGDDSALIGAFPMSVDKREGFNRLLGIGYLNTTGWPAVLVYDQEETVDRSYTTGESALPNGPIDTELVTKEYTPPDEMTEMVYAGTEVSARVDINTRLQVVAEVDGGAKSDTNSKTISADESSSADDASFDRVTIYPSARKPGGSLQIQLSDLPGYIIDDTNNWIIWRRGILFLYELTKGYYASMSELMDHIISAMNTASGSAAFSWSLSGGMIQITRNTSTWNYVVKPTGNSVVDARLDQSVALWGLLGFDTSADPAAAASQTATTEKYYKRSSSLEITGIVIRATPFNRRP